MHGHDGHLLFAATTSIPFMSSWPSPQYSEQRIGNSPTAVATNSIVTGSPPRGIFLSILNFLICRPCTPSPDLTSSLMRSPSVTSTRDGSKLNRVATTSTVRGAEAAAGSCWLDIAAAPNKSAVPAAATESFKRVSDTYTWPGISKVDAETEITKNKERIRKWGRFRYSLFVLRYSGRVSVYAGRNYSI